MLKSDGLGFNLAVFAGPRGTTVYDYSGTKEARLFPPPIPC
jgi:hypothetical protein